MSSCVFGTQRNARRDDTRDTKHETTNANADSRWYGTHAQESVHEKRAGEEDEISPHASQSEGKKMIARATADEDGM